VVLNEVQNREIDIEQKQSVARILGRLELTDFDTGKSRPSDHLQPSDPPTENPRVGGSIPPLATI
jgi:hypothetical protein